MASADYITVLNEKGEPSMHLSNGTWQCDEADCDYVAELETCDGMQVCGAHRCCRKARRLDDHRCER